MAKKTSQKKVAVPALSEVAVLVRPTFSFWEATKKSAKQSREYNESRGTEKQRVLKDLVFDEDHDTAKRIRNDFRTYVYDVTLPWADSGLRVLKASKVSDFVDRANEAKSEFELHVDRFLRKYRSGEVQTEAAAKLNGDYDDAEYPDYAKVSGKFLIKWKFKPVPRSGDFRVELPDHLKDDIGKDCDVDEAEVMKSSMKEAWQRLHDVVKTAADTLADTKTSAASAKSGKRFCETLITNMSDLDLDALNMAGDPELAKLGKKVKEMVAEMDSRRMLDDKTARREGAKAAREAAKEIARKMKGAGTF